MLTLGRCTGLIETNRTVAGDMVSIEGVTPDVSYDSLCGIRQQLLGLIDNEDETVVPCTSSDDPDFDGFYRPVSINVGHIGTQDDGAFTFSATLQQLRSYSSSMFEVTVQSVLRANALGITAPAHIIVCLVRAVSRGVTLLPPNAGWVAASGTVAEGGVALNRMSRSTFDSIVRYSFGVPPSKFYLAGCKIERRYGAMWVPVNGRSIPDTTQGQWRISNGLIRFTLGATSVDPAVIEVWDNATAAWEPTSMFNGVSSLGIGYDELYPDRLEVVRNSPETVIVRHTASDVQSSFSLNRGVHHIAWTRKESNNLGNLMGVKFATATASTALTAGIRATANDAYGNRGIIASAHPCTADLTNGKLSLTSGRFVSTFMLGVELKGSAAANGDTADQVVGQFMGATTWKQRIVTP